MKTKPKYKIKVERFERLYRPLTWNNAANRAEDGRGIGALAIGLGGSPVFCVSFLSTFSGNREPGRNAVDWMTSTYKRGQPTQQSRRVRKTRQCQTAFDRFIPNEFRHKKWWWTYEMTMTQQLTLKRRIPPLGRKRGRTKSKKNSPAKKCFSFGTKIETFDDDTFKKNWAIRQWEDVDNCVEDVRERNEFRKW